MKTKKLLAIGLATVLTLASSVTAFAAEDPVDAPTSGTGTYEGYVEKTVVAGTTTTETTSTLDFAIDPQKLAAAVSKYDGKEIDDTATVLFARADSGKAKDYEGRSDSIILTSRSSVDADMTVKATLSSIEGYELVETPEDLTSDETGAPQLYIALTDGENTVALTSATVSITETIEGDPEQFEITYADSKYSFDEIESATFNSEEVWIIAEAAGKWTDVTVPSITLAYATEAHADYVDAGAPFANWSGQILWMAVDASTGFTSSNPTVEISVDDGATYAALANTVSDANWVSVNYSDISAKLDGATNYKIRITDGNNQYTLAY